MASQALLPPQLPTQQMQLALQGAVPRHPPAPARAASLTHFCKYRKLQAIAATSLKVPKLNAEQRNASPHQGFRRLVSVSASAEAAAPTLFDPAHRAKLAEEYGFTQIGEPLPPDVTMRQLIATIPPEAFKMNEWKAWRSLAISLVAYISGLCLTAIAPWYLLPFGWAWTGTAVAGLFVIAHECGHRNFSSNKLIEDIVGNLAFVPLIYPFEPWRFKHDQHHSKANMLYEDSAWIPVMKEEYATSPPFIRTMFMLLMGPLRFWGTIYHWIDRHFFLNKFRPNEQNRVKISLGVVFATITIGWPLLIYLTGVKGWVNFFLMPWLGFHFWMSLITMIHHSAPHIKFQPEESWNNAEAHLVGTVNCTYPKLIEFISHDIMVHVPHHISPKIPSYNLRLANDALRKRWGKHFTEARLNWRLLKTHFTICHIYDAEKGYVAFDEGKDEIFLLGLLRRLMPNHA